MNFDLLYHATIRKRVDSEIFQIFILFVEPLFYVIYSFRRVLQHPRGLYEEHFTFKICHHTYLIINKTILFTYIAI